MYFTHIPIVFVPSHHVTFIVTSQACTPFNKCVCDHTKCNSGCCDAGPAKPQSTPGSKLSELSDSDPGAQKCDLRFKQLGKADPDRSDRKKMFEVQECTVNNNQGGLYFRIRSPVNIAYILLDCGPGKSANMTVSITMM